MPRKPTQAEREAIEEEALEILRAYEHPDKPTMAALAERYGYSVTTISRRIHDAHWRREKYRKSREI